MGSILDLSLPATGLTRAADDIIAQLMNVTDDNGNTVFATVQRGLIKPSKEEPRKDTVPAARLWYERKFHDIKNVQFYASESYVDIGLYLYFYSFEQDSNKEPVDLQDIVDRITTLTINYLRKNTDDPNSIGFTPTYSSWSFDVPQQIPVENTNVLRKFSNNIVILPPWYVSKISIRVRVNNIS